jgi:predicted patatin/cPLA2 family phospholipase
MISKLKREFKWEPFGLSSLASTLEKGNKNVTKVVRNEPSSSNLGARLKKLRQMYKDGILSKVEFEKAKNKLLK